MLLERPVPHEFGIIYQMHSNFYTQTVLHCSALRTSALATGMDLCQYLTLLNLWVILPSAEQLCSLMEACHVPNLSPQPR